jgi:hypothetical protein
MTDHTAAFIIYASSRKLVAGPRGVLVRLARYHAPMARAGHQVASLPVLRNRCDVRRHWPDDAAADRLWCEFCATLDDEARKVARSLDDLDARHNVDADARRDARRRTVVAAWAAAYGDRPVTAAELRASPVHEAIATTHGLTDEISARLIAEYVRTTLAAVAIPDCGWRVVKAEPDRHAKAKRWKLEPLTD